MKTFFCIVSTLFVVAACTIDKTDYESESTIVVPDNQAFKEVISFEQESYVIRVEALEGKLYQGYNEIRVHLLDANSKQSMEHATVTLVPVLTTGAGTRESCPTSDAWTYVSQEKYYKGYSVFTKESTAGQWALVFDIQVGGQHLEHLHPIEVFHQTNMNLNMTSFVGNDQEHYIIALVAPVKPKVAENDIVAGIFKYNSAADTSTWQGLHQAYTSVDHYTLRLDPRMPEPSMGNHSSPNNRDLVQREDSFYQGVVNYTMTGNWTLNFILQNNQGRIVKGTKVPTDFTPGVAGVKSELFIDILF